MLLLFCAFRLRVNVTHLGFHGQDGHAVRLPVDCGCRVSPAKPTTTSSSTITTFWPGLLKVRRLEVPSFWSVILVSENNVTFPASGSVHFCDHKRHNSSFHAAPAVVNNALRIRIS